LFSLSKKNISSNILAQESFFVNERKRVFRFYQFRQNLTKLQSGIIIKKKQKTIFGIERERYV